VVDLDDISAVSATDAGDMLGAVAGMAEDLSEGYARGRAAKDLPEANGITAIALCGMGGSAVGADITRALYLSRLGVPIQVVRNTSLPEWCETRTLVVSTSYSGGTAETLASFEEAAERGCRQVAITAGGEMARRAGELDVPVVSIEDGYQPRAALGLLSGSLLGVLEVMGVVPSLASELDETSRVLTRLAEELGLEARGNRAKAMAARILEATPVVWGAEGLGAAAAMR
jgi:glucose/mannose-6-phosphate isomerase